MRHKHADLIALWVEDNLSVQSRSRNIGWMNFNLVSEFDNSNLEFRRTPKPEYRYDIVSPSSWTIGRRSNDNVKVTMINGKVVAVELLVPDDGK